MVNQIAIFWLYRSTASWAHRDRSPENRVRYLDAIDYGRIRDRSMAQYSLVSKIQDLCRLSLGSHST